MDNMDVIDLCDDDDDQTTVQPNTPTCSKNIIKSEKDCGAKSNEAPRVPPIRVVNLASLQTAPRVITVEPTKDSQPNRRKSIHQTLPHANNAGVVFPAHSTANKIRIVRSVSNALPTASSSVSAERTSAVVTAPHTLRGPATSNLPRRKLAARRNDELMKRVAFLRVCAEYMLRDLDMPNISLGEDPSLKVLMAQYASAKLKRSSMTTSSA